jgi:hypothetical protein
MRQVEIVPYDYTPRPGALAALKTLLFDYFGARADVRIADALPYRAEATEILNLAVRREFPLHAGARTGAPARESCLVVLFSLAGSPESEVHGRLLEALTLELDPAREQMLIVLDVSTYRDRMLEPTRVRERIDAWSRVVHGAGLTALPIDLERHLAPAGTAGERSKGGAAEELHGAVHAALWPDRETAPAGTGAG